MESSDGKVGSTIENFVDTGLGLSDDFEAYVPPQPEDYAGVLTGGMVVLDANVLLNLYRYNALARQEFLELLTKLRDRLFIPHQVVREFWRNRETVIAEQSGAGAALIESLQKQLDLSNGAIRAWGRRYALEPNISGSVESLLEEGYARAAGVIEELHAPQEGDGAPDTVSDDVVQGLLPILDSRVGAPLSEQEHKNAVKEGVRRVEEQVPPGYRDAKKDPDLERTSGDYLVWKQLLLEAAKRNLEVLFVTAERKDDWWRMERSQIRGPRPELAVEVKRACGRRFFMMGPDSLVKIAGEVLDFNVSEESLTDIQRVDDFAPDGEWTMSAFVQLLDRLAQQAPVQEEALAYAADHEGFVPREVIYEIGGYEPTRSLRGFTRPVRRLTLDLIAEGVVGPNVPEVIAPVYDQTVAAQGVAIGFKMPAEVTWLFGTGK